MILIKNARYFDGNDIIDDSAVSVCGEKISRVFRGTKDYREEDYETVIDAKGRLVVPGYIDIHIHGCGGYDVMDNTEDSIQKISEILAKHGTTSFLPTTVTQSRESTQKTIALVRKIKGHSKGADVLGVHLEGPFINIQRKGAQNPNYILSPSVQSFQDFVGNDLTDIMRVTLAPEQGEGTELVRWLTQKGICVSAGHTCADFDTIENCVDNGLNLATHLFNGMNPFNHRDPGTVGASLLDDRIYTEFIADLIHLNKMTLILIVKVKGSDKCILITDSLSAACLGDGNFSLGGQKVIVKNKQARLEGGSLAGSVITMQEAVKNMIQKVGIKETDVFKMATENPAKILKIDTFKGSIKEGYDADLNLLDDDYNVTLTMVRGKFIHVVTGRK